MSTQHLILSAIGADRPGLVDEVTSFIFGHGGNIQDSRMVNLQGQFAIMMLCTMDESAANFMRQDLPKLTRQTSLHLELREAQTTRPAAAADALPYRLTATAIDQPGLVQRISHLLRNQNVNIESLETRLSAAPITGAPVFEMDLTISIPRTTPLGRLRQSLGALCDQLNIDWQLAALS